MFRPRTNRGFAMRWLNAGISEFERELIRERTKAGMAAAKLRGRHVGRPRKLTPHQPSTGRKRALAANLFEPELVLSWENPCCGRVTQPQHQTERATF